MKDNTAAVRTQVPVDVATFLLNEKRADIQAIELRHKVNILLIPNIHLETPQHSIIRLRHDELNQDDLQQPSYKMVDMPLEDDAKQASSASETKAPRQEAAIKGITPAQPAPIVAEKAAPEVKKAEPEGIFAKIMSWFRSTPQPAPLPEPEKKPRSNNAPREGQRDGRRGGRNKRSDEDRESRGNREQKEAREPRQGQTQNLDENPKQREPREPKEPRRPRGEPRPERKELTAATVEAKAGILATPTSAAPGNPEQTSEEGNNAGRRRGRRGGRRERGEPREGQATEIVSAIAAETVAPQPSPVTTKAPVAEQPAVAAFTPPVDSTNDQVEMPAVVSETRQVETIAAPSAVVEHPEQAPIEAVAPVVIEIPKRVEPVAEPSTPIVIPSTLDISKALEESGLVMVETSSDKAQSWQPETTASEAVVPRPRRKRPEPVAVSNEPMQMVETQK